MTGGKPYNSTQTVVMYIQKIAFEQYKLGYAGSISVLFMITLLIVSYIQLKAVGTNE